MRRLAAPLLGASAVLSVLTPAAPALADDHGLPLLKDPLIKDRLKDPLVKDEANDICLAPTKPNGAKPNSSQSTCDGSSSGPSTATAG